MGMSSGGGPAFGNRVQRMYMSSIAGDIFTKFHLFKLYLEVRRRSEMAMDTQDESFPLPLRQIRRRRCTQGPVIRSWMFHIRYLMDNIRQMSISPPDRGTTPGSRAGHTCPNSGSTAGTRTTRRSSSGCSAVTIKARVLNIFTCVHLLSSIYFPNSTNHSDFSIPYYCACRIITCHLRTTKYLVKIII